MAAYQGRVHLDLGSGDALGPYRWALRDPHRLFLASDANASGLLDTAWRAARKSSRGGIPNLICIGESLDVLAAELSRIAHRISVILPWGSLLRTVAAPDIRSLRQIAKLCLLNASIEVVFSYDPQRDRREGDRLGISNLDEKHITFVLPEIYKQAGLQVVAAEKIPLRELLAYETTWASRLAAGRARNVWRLSAKPASELAGI